MKFMPLREKAIPIRRDDSLQNIPSVCYNDCNAVALDGQRDGKSDELCEPGSSFLKALDHCSTCINANPDSKNTTTVPEFVDWVGFCNNATTVVSVTSTDTVATGPTVVVVTSSDTVDEPAVSSLLRAQASLRSELSALGVTSPVTNTATATNTGSSREQATSSTDNHTGGGSKDQIIIPAVLVPVVIISLSIALGVFLMMRRHNKGALSPPPMVEEPTFENKAQLHSDDFRPELEATGSNSGSGAKILQSKLNERPAELPAGEVARELESEGQAINRNT